MKQILMFFFTAMTIVSYSASPDYNVKNIPANLLVNSKAVIRTNDITFEISGINKAVQKVKYAITVLNENGINQSVFVQFYNKFLSVRNFKIELYDANGMEIRNRNSVELKDYSAMSGYSLYEDNRVKFMNPNYRNTPFTVEYSYEINFQGLLSYPDWNVYPDYNVAVQHSCFRIIAPEGFQFRYIEKNLQNKCVKTIDKGKAVYSWEVSDKQSIVSEPYSYPLPEYTPAVECAPNDFELEDYKGNLNSWLNFGKWITDLAEDRSELPEETCAKVRGIVSGLNDKDKIQKIYEYLQNKVRYVSVQVGIGGWQPIDAETVDRLSYGDCKALSNYMKSLLDIAGIKSFYSLINAGQDAFDVNSNFPANKFNHVILCVPVEKDTVWLECTSQRLPCGYIGTFTDDRNSLIVNSTGSKIVRTPAYSMDDNQRSRTASFLVKTDGSAEALVNTTYKGFFYDKTLPLLLADDADKKKFIESSISIPGFIIKEYSNKEIRGVKPSISEDIHLTIPKYSSVIGAKLILNANPFFSLKDLPYSSQNRMSPVWIRRSTRETDSIVFKIQSPFKTANIPPDKSISSRFGEYSARIIADKDEIIYIRKLKLFKGDYQASSYPDFVDFYEKIALSDQLRVTLDIK